MVPNAVHRFSGDHVFELCVFASEVDVPDNEMFGSEQVLARYRFVEEFQGFLGLTVVDLDAKQVGAALGAFSDLV